MKYEQVVCLMALYSLALVAPAIQDDGFCKAATGCHGGNELEQRACVVDLDGCSQVASVYECSDIQRGKSSKAVPLQSQLARVVFIRTL